jgi:uncharacterized protein (DUF488 family)
MKTVVTIGVYGFSEEGFFEALVGAGVEAFVDIRWRRGVRGATYAFANHKRLESRLEGLGIAYVHRRNLAPTPLIRQQQTRVDKSERVAKRKRTTLSQGFIDSYKDEILGNFDAGSFWEGLPEGVKVAALFCVESAPEACHRSLVAEVLREEGGVVVRHLMPE